MTLDPSKERTRSALMTLSVVGAALAGAGVGSLLGAGLRPLAWWIFGVGLVAHLIGMVGIRRFLAAGGYVPPAWQKAAYWLCWAAIGIVVTYGLFEVAT